MLKHIVSLWILWWTTSVYGAVADAVVMVDGCSGVCVDPAGLVFTVRHCNLPQTVTVRFKDRSVTATRVYVCREVEGPVVYDCEGDGYPYVPVAASPPRIGERLWSYGYPQVKDRRELRWTSGPLLRWSTFQYGGGSFSGNVVGFRTCPGWSGGPLLNATGEVCGLLNSADSVTSVFVSSASVREAYAATRQSVGRTPPRGVTDRPRLFVFGSINCTPCRRFKNDYGTNTELRRTLEATYAVEFVDIEEQAELARQFHIGEVPTFLVPGRDPVVGYDGADQLLISLGLRQEIIDGPSPVPDEPAAEPATPAVEAPEKQEVSEPPRATPKPAPADTTIVLSQPATVTSDAIQRMRGLVEKAVTLATWLGVGGMTSGAGGLLLGGIALWRTVRKRRRSRMGRDPPLNEKPSMVTVDSPPPPQAIVPETRFAPYERDTFAEAFTWAESELVRKYPGAVGTLESLRGLIDQYLAAKGLTRADRP